MRPSTSNLIDRYKSRKKEENYNIQKENDIRIVFNCREGSVSHYYHFLYGAMIPLIEYHINNPDKQLLITTDVGPFKSILMELFEDVIVGFESPDIPSGAEYFDDKSMNYVRNKVPGEIILPAYDLFNTKLYNNDRSINSLKRLEELIPLVNNFIEMKMPEKYKNVETYEILVIERDVDDYYINKRITNEDVKRDIFYTSGKQRRDVLNHREMMEELRGVFGTKINNIVLEKKSLFYQYQLFKNASIVIGQHGAGLGNIFFMKPNSNLIEIMSPWGRQGNHFRNLSHYLRINYRYVFMENDIDNINISELVRMTIGMDDTSRISERKRSPSRRRRSRSKSPPTRRYKNRSRSRSMSPSIRRHRNRSPPTRRRRSRSRSPYKKRSGRY